MCLKNKLAKTHGFFPCVCSGINSLEEVLENFRRQSAFFAVDDTNDGVTERRSGGFFKKRTFTVFLMKRYTFNDMSNELVYLNTDNVYMRELGEYFINGCTGLYFMIDVSEPIDLSFNADEWEE